MGPLIISDREQIGPTEFFGLRNKISNSDRNTHVSSVEDHTPYASDSGKTGVRVDPGEALDNAVPSGT